MSCITSVEDDEEFMIATAKGLIARQAAKNISSQGRMATGVKVQNMDSDDSVITVNKIVEITETEENLDTSSASQSLPEVDDIEMTDEILVAEED